jgi:hypothetical protein
MSGASGSTGTIDCLPLVPAPGQHNMAISGKPQIGAQRECKLKWEPGR